MYHYTGAIRGTDYKNRKLSHRPPIYQRKRFADPALSYLVKMVIGKIYGVLEIMLNKVIGILLIGLAVWLFFNFSPGNAEARGSVKKMLISIVIAFISVTIAYCGIQIFNGNALNLF